jgi:hypothetical protein
MAPPRARPGRASLYTRPLLQVTPWRWEMKPSHGAENAASLQLRSPPEGSDSDRWRLDRHRSSSGSPEVNGGGERRSSTAAAATERRCRDITNKVVEANSGTSDFWDCVSLSIKNGQLFHFISDHWDFATWTSWPSLI